MINNDYQPYNLNLLDINALEFRILHYYMIPKLAAIFLYCKND